MIPVVYDTLNRWAKDADFFSGLVKRFNPETMADLGCGTGRLTLRFAEYTNVTGIDPNAEALDIAKQKPQADRVKWVQGESAQLEDEAYDLVLMTANVSQLFVDDAEWQQVVADAYRSLKKDGRFVFDTRNPKAHIWDRWMRDDSPDIATIGDKTYEVHNAYKGYKNEVFTFTETLYEGDEEVTSVEIQLRFREMEAWKNSLTAAGFTVETYGDFTWREADKFSEDLVFIATK
ncbi:class I SAM-dependent methyltransferase [Kurthia massiliensis]|uniref:class I SAM-dependent methyltransferase n=1 Tax=Kurthia massiliensis TaxID=1033739 RepID=UPI0002887D02|nr:class I SAM-dependent methyltransferase [Kurthia massiliensis]